MFTTTSCSPEIRPDSAEQASSLAACLVLPGCIFRRGMSKIAFQCPDVSTQAPEFTVDILFVLVHSSLFILSGPMLDGRKAIVQ